VQQGVGQCRLLPEVRGVAQQACQRMCGWQRAERDDEIPNLAVGGLDADTATEFLQHVNARPSVRRIHHEVHGPVRVEHVAQCPERCLRVREMVQNARAHDLIERQLQIADPIDRELMDREIVQVVLALEIFRVPDARRAEVDADDPGRGTARGVLRRLRCSAAGDEDRALFCLRLARPEQVEVRAASVRVLPPPSIVVEIVGRPRVREPFVEVLDCCRHIMAGSRCWLPAVECLRYQATRLLLPSASTRRRQLLQNLIEREAPDLLARQEIPERGDVLRDVLLRRHEQASAVNSPTGIADAIVVPVKEFVARVWSLPRKSVADVVAVEMDLEAFLAHLHACEQLLLDVRNTDGRKQRGEHVFV
jgi:hypothetical protein